MSIGGGIIWAALIIVFWWVPIIVLAVVIVGLIFGYAALYDWLEFRKRKIKKYFNRV